MFLLYGESEFLRNYFKRILELGGSSGFYFGYLVMCGDIFDCYIEGGVILLVFEGGG